MCGWFISYAIKREGVDAIGYGSATISWREHPIAIVNRWNKEIAGQKMVLLFYRGITEDEEVTEMDVEVAP